MRLESIPLYVGVLVGLVGLWLLWDAMLADRGRAARRERRRRERAERDRLGEATLGLGTLCVAAALVGSDVWRWGNVAAIAGAVLLLVGAALNFRFLRELLVHRGPARRQPDRDPRGPEADRYVLGDAMGAADVPPPLPDQVADDAGHPAPREAVGGNPASGDAERVVEDGRLGPR